MLTGTVADVQLRNMDSRNDMTDTKQSFYKRRKSSNNEVNKLVDGREKVIIHFDKYTNLVSKYSEKQMGDLNLGSK